MNPEFIRRGLRRFAILTATIIACVLNAAPQAAGADSRFGYYLLNTPRNEATSIIGGQLDATESIRQPSLPVRTRILQGLAQQTILDQASHDTAVRAKFLGFIRGSSGSASAISDVECLGGLQIVTYDGALPLPFGESVVVESALVVTSFTVRTGNSSADSTNVVANSLRDLGSALPGQVQPTAATTAADCGASSNAAPTGTASPAPSPTSSALTAASLSPILVSATNDNSRVHVTFTSGSGLVIGVKRLHLVQQQLQDADAPITFASTNDTSLLGDTNVYRVQFADDPENSATRLCVDVTQINLSSLENMASVFCPSKGKIKFENGDKLGHYRQPADGRLSVRAGVTSEQQTNRIPTFTLEYDSSNLDLANLTFTFSSLQDPALEKVDGKMNIHRNLFAGQFLDT